MYRPNEAKVKNLKTKDYLGKARLVATADSKNTGVGFAGAERAQALQRADAAKDDRPAENISYAATNLVQRSLTSRAAPRESSAPPAMGRNVFPPTPPPEGDKPAGSRGSTGSAPQQMPHRSASMRNPPSNMQPPPPRGQGDPRPGMLVRSQTDNFGRRGQDPNMMSPRGSYGEPTRAGTVRGSSEPRGASSRQPFPSRSMSQRAPAPAPLFRETTPRARFERDPAEDTVDDVYGLYAQSRQMYGGGRDARGSPYMIDEADEDDYIDETDVGPDDMAGFEPVYNRSPPQSRLQPSMSVRTKRIDMRKIRCKVHANDDTRYIMLQADGPMGVDFGEFESKIREKFAVKSALKIRMRDLEDGDMITMGDQDDLDMLLQSVRTQARKEKSEMGKMEVWVRF